MRKLCLIAFALVTSAGAALAEYPDHPIRLIVPQAAGSATDNAARLVGAVLSQELGQQIIVENRPGGALTIGLDLVAKSAPDGYTIGMGPIGALARFPRRTNDRRSRRAGLRRGDVARRGRPGEAAAPDRREAQPGRQRRT